MTRTDLPSKGVKSAPTRKRQHPTLGDVARHVGVSSMTASRALNKPHLVSKELRGRIEAAVEELGYIQDRVAGHLASGGSDVIPVLVPTLNHGVYVPVLNALNDDLGRAGHQILLGTSEYDPAREEHAVQTLLGWRPAGIVLSGIDHTPRTRTLLRAAGVPVVELMDVTDTPIDLNIGFDHAAVGRAVALDLIARGYRKVAYLGCVTRIDQRSVRRIRAFQGRCGRPGWSAPSRPAVSSRVQPRWAATCWPHCCEGTRTWTRCSAATTTWPPGHCSARSGWACGCRTTWP